VELKLQALDLMRHLLELVVGDHANLAVLERHRVAAVGLGADAVETEDLAGHLEAGHLFATVLEQHVGLERARADRVDRLERVTGAVQIVLALDLAARAHQFVEPAQLTIGHSEGEAQLDEVALRTGRFEPIHGNWHASPHLHDNPAFLTLETPALEWRDC